MQPQLGALDERLVHDVAEVVVDVQVDAGHAEALAAAVVAGARGFAVVVAGVLVVVLAHPDVRGQLLHGGEPHGGGGDVDGRVDAHGIGALGGREPLPVRVHHGDGGAVFRLLQGERERVVDGLGGVGGDGRGQREHLAAGLAALAFLADDDGATLQGHLQVVVRLDAGAHREGLHGAREDDVLLHQGADEGVLVVDPGEHLGVADGVALGHRRRERAALRHEAHAVAVLLDGDALIAHGGGDGQGALAGLGRVHRGGVDLGPVRARLVALPEVQGDGPIAGGVACRAVPGEQGRRELQRAVRLVHGDERVVDGPGLALLVDVGRRGAADDGAVLRVRQPVDGRAVAGGDELALGLRLVVVVGGGVEDRAGIGGVRFDVGIAVFGLGRPAIAGRLGSLSYGRPGIAGRRRGVPVARIGARAARCARLGRGGALLGGVAGCPA